jgi:hypothetical protein
MEDKRVSSAHAVSLSLGINPAVNQRVLKLAYDLSVTLASQTSIATINRRSKLMLTQEEVEKASAQFHSTDYG